MTGANTSKCKAPVWYSASSTMYQHGPTYYDLLQKLYLAPSEETKTQFYTYEPHNRFIHKWDLAILYTRK